MASTVTDLINYIDLTKSTLLISVGSIAFNPLAWNIVARQEHHNQILTRLFGGRSRPACYFLAVCIFSFGIIRDILYKSALAEQPQHPALLSPYVQAAAIALFVWGNILVVTSTWQLGITGTFLGDYFGILKDEMVTGFPFNVTSSPMYSGSTMSFLGTALWYGKPAGILLTAWVYLVYAAALRYEDPFTTGIYAKRDRERAAAQSGKKQK